MRRWLAAVFVLSFAGAALVAALLVRRIALPTPRPAAVATSAIINSSANSTGADAGADVDGDSGDYWPDHADTPEQVIYAQPQMLRDAVARLAPRKPDRPNLYFIGFAGDAEEDVFRNEAEYAATLFAKRFDASGHELLLVNNPATLSRYPLATLTNLETAIDAVAKKMDRDTDILLLLLSSHGSADHLLYVAMEPLPLDQIAPEDLADIFAKVPIRNKIVVISACYSGGFIGALRDAGTMIVTAARGDRTSFGCGNDSPITDFGHAFFVAGLNHHDSFDAAFAAASKSINAQETRAGEEHSHPQFVTTAQIEAALTTWRQGIRLGAPVPFLPPPNPGNGASLPVSR